MFTDMFQRMSSIQSRLDSILSSLPQGTRLVAVSKYHPVEMIMEAYEAGHRIFGESHVQELQEKRSQLPADIEWHFIGHLQTNKVKYIAPFVRMIHSIDSLPLLQTVEKEAAKHERCINCLLQFHIATEETKFGLDLDEARQLLESAEYKAMQHVRICGVMGMATNTDDMGLVRREFATLHDIFETLKKDYFSGSNAFCEISMGMSHDYKIAVEEGSTLVRVGSSIFGARNYGVPVNDV